MQSRRLGRDLHERRITHALVATERMKAATGSADSAVGAPTRIGSKTPRTKTAQSAVSRRIFHEEHFRSARFDRRLEHGAKRSLRWSSRWLAAKSPHGSHAGPSAVLEIRTGTRDRVAVSTDRQVERLGIPLASVVDLVRRLAARASFILLSAQANRPSHNRSNARRESPLAISTTSSWKAAIRRRRLRSLRPTRERCTFAG